MRPRNGLAMGLRIAIVGTSGAGKTTLARQVAAILDIPHVELDALFWKPNWEQSESWEFCDRVDAATQGDTWVVDGNYLRVRPMVWERATTIVWLNYSLPLILWRVLRRTFLRCQNRQELWNGCYETFQKSFWSQDSIILWTLKTNGRNRRAFPLWLTLPQYQHLEVVELIAPAAAENWLETLRTSRPSALVKDDEQ